MRRNLILGEIRRGREARNAALRAQCGAELRHLREDRDLSLRALASASHLSATYLSQLERGHSIPTEDVIYRLAETLDCDEDLLLAYSGRVSQDILDIILEQPAEIAELLLAIDGLPGPTIESITRFARTRRSHCSLGEQTQKP